MTIGSTVGVPVDRNRAAGVSMSPARNPKPMMTPAASSAWTMTISGSIAPIWATVQRGRVP
ncbi:hypothetical protein ACLQ2R_10510 [Streptosporangium sp. DT93]|uniref:hypothetical protein n=1 Tax=Streptosporangium sp. DT93 TaxID=3393428 RepID=UPI003CF26A2C